MSDVLNKKLWSTENVIKLSGFILGLYAQFMFLKQEIHDHKVDDKAEKTIIGYRLDELEKCCGGTKRPQYAILPKAPNIENERED
jgi:hypothetical protein